MTLLRPESGVASALSLSPNHGERRGALVADCLILHYTGMKSGPAALSWLCDPSSQVSSHYFVGEDARVIQLVPESRRAWHAGRSSWNGQTDINSASIGIEIVNAGHEFGTPPFPDAQIDAVIALCRDLCARHALAPERVLAHSDVAPARKRDPGEAFPWARLHQEGVGHWSDPPPVAGGRFLSRGDSGEPVKALQAMLVLYGYECPATGAYDEATECVVRAFQRHFRPARVDGIADGSTITALRNLLAALPGKSRAE